MLIQTYIRDFLSISKKSSGKLFILLAHKNIILPCAQKSDTEVTTNTFFNIFPEMKTPATVSHLERTTGPVHDAIIQYEVLALLDEIQVGLHAQMAAFQGSKPVLVRIRILKNPRGRSQTECREGCQNYRDHCPQKTCKIPYMEIFAGFMDC